eukprot:8286069-Pyramimonas_sp.AAC.1
MQARHPLEPSLHGRHLVGTWETLAAASRSCMGGGNARSIAVDSRSKDGRQRCKVLARPKDGPKWQ